MSKNNSKKQGKITQRQLQRLQQLQKMEKQRIQRQQREKQLAERSSPLIEMGLLDAYEFVLTQLIKTGIPQNNVYEFAAQAILKFEKSKNKKHHRIKEINQLNQVAIKEVIKKSPNKSVSKAKKSINTLPFKNQVTPEQLAILEKVRERYQP